MKKLLILFFLLMISAVSYSQLTKQLEKYYQNAFAKIVGGETQQYLPNKRIVDIVTYTFAIEVEFANKYPESIGQSLGYAMMLNKKPGILLIVNGINDDKYVTELMNDIDYYHLPITVWVMDYNTDNWSVVTTTAPQYHYLNK